MLLAGLDGIMSGISSLINSALHGGFGIGRRSRRRGALMAESEMGGERTEEPSQRRLQEARERGQVPRSRELTNFATMIGGSAALVAIGGTVAAHLVAADAELTVDRRNGAAQHGLDGLHRWARRASAPSPRFCRCSARSW